MVDNLVVNGNNSLTKGTVIFEKGQPLKAVGLIVKGRVVVKSEGVHTTLGTGNFLGMYDALQGKHSFTYVALDDCVIYGLPITGVQQANLLLEEKPQYRGLLITSINFFLQDVYRIYTKIKQQLDNVAGFVEETYSEYKNLADQSGIMPEMISTIDKLEKELGKDYSLPEKMNYFTQCCLIPVEAQKNYYGANSFVAKNYFKDQCKVLPELVKLSQSVTQLLRRYFRVMVMDEKNLFSLVAHMALGVKRAGQDATKLCTMLDQIVAYVNDTEGVLLEKAGVDMKLDRERMEEAYIALMSNDIEALDAKAGDDLMALNNSLHQILDYATVHGRISEEFEEEIEAFKELPDPFAKSQEAIAIRKKITQHFYEIYKSVVLKSFEDRNPPKAVKLFLRYGYVSETLLKKDELRKLLTLPDSREEKMSCRVYSLPEWLRAIYDGYKNPSKNEYDLDYEDILRQQLREGKISKIEQQDAMENSEEKVCFEVDNLFHYANRILNGNITSFVPILCSGTIFTKLEKAVVTAAAINQAVNKIEKIDYKLFHREHMIALEEIGLSNFEVTERFTPDFILFPIFGRNALMWQDLEGRNKSSHARILLPSFMEHDLPGNILKVLAHYRWERCRTEMGSQWNNFHYPSLTSEYTDYLQFYRKNNDLSPERKERVKAQLQQCNNKHREVFTRDYIDWILRESTGVVKLNHVVRKILYTYCPFAEEQAKQVLEQTTYRDAARRYMVARGKREKLLISVKHKYEKADLEVPEEVEETIRLLMET